MTTNFKNPHSKHSIKSGSGLGDIISSIPKFINDNKDTLNNAITITKQTKDIVDNIITTAKKIKTPKKVDIKPDVKIDEEIVENIMNPEKKKGNGFNKIL